MYDKFDKMLEKKGKKISPIEQKAKMDVLSDLSNEASEMMGDKLSGLKKATDPNLGKSSKELEHGFEAAKELMKYEEQPQHLGSENPEVDQSPEEKLSTDRSLSNEEIDKKIEELLKLKEEIGDSNDNKKESY